MKVSNNIPKNVDLVDSFWKFRQPDLIIVSCGLLLGIISCFILQVGSSIEVYFIIPFFSTLLAMGLVVDHKRCILLNKENDSFTVIEKMLFFNKYRIVHKLALSEFANVYLKEHHGSKGGTTYNVVIITKNNKEIALTSYSDSRRNHWQNIVDMICQFMQGSSDSLIFEDSPFGFRTIALIITILILIAFISSIVGRI